MTMIRMLALVALAACTLLCAGCGRKFTIDNYVHKGFVITEFYTKPATVMAGETVTLGFKRLLDEPPDTVHLGIEPSVYWAISAGSLYPMEHELFPDGASGVSEVTTWDYQPRVLWQAPDTPQQVTVTARCDGGTLTALIEVY